MLKISKTESQFSTLKRYFSLLKKMNEGINLVRFRSDEELWVKHFLDSAQGAKYLDPKVIRTALDLGTGGGFPGLVLAILHPSIQFTLLDSTRKKIDALKKIVAQLRVRNVTLIWDRAENLQTPFDMVVARAIKPLRELIPLAAPLVKNHGQFLAYKGPRAADEIRDAAAILEHHHFILQDQSTFDLPQGFGKRTLLLFSHIC